MFSASVGPFKNILQVIFLLLDKKNARVQCLEILSDVTIWHNCHLGVTSQAPTAFVDI